MACFMLALSVAAPLAMAEVHRHKPTFVDKTVHATVVAGEGIKTGAVKTSGAVTGAAKATGHGTTVAGKSVAHGTMSAVHATGKGMEKSGGAMAKAGE